MLYKLEAQSDAGKEIDAVCVEITVLEFCVFFFRQNRNVIVQSLLKQLPCCRAGCLHQVKDKESPFLH